MKIIDIEWKNLFAFGEEPQKISYIDGELVLLKGKSGSGKSAILSMPALLLYGKLEKITKSAIANRINKHGWIKGNVENKGHIYTIERTFAPNDVHVYKDGIDIESYGSSSAQDYIEKEIVDIPIQAFSNMVSISLEDFKSFLTMSPADRKQIIDRVFNLEIVNIAYEKMRKDAREVGNNINASNTTLFQLSQTLTNTTNELLKLQQRTQDDDHKAEIDENVKKIEELNKKIEQYNVTYKEYSEKAQTFNTNVINLRQQINAINYNINAIQEKINLFSQDKCPTCGASFSSDAFKNLNDQLVTAKKQQEEQVQTLNQQLVQYNDSYTKIQTYLQQLTSGVYQMKSSVNTLLNTNRMLEEKSKENVEFTGIQNIINDTTAQIDAIKAQISSDNIKLKDLQNLCLVYSIEGVKQKVINDYLPILNKEVENNLELVSFPYHLSIDAKFEPHLMELNMEIMPQTLSAGEKARVNLIILCSLFKLLKRRFPTINILFIDEVVSYLDNETSGEVMKYLKAFAIDNNLSCFIVSHTDLYLDNFDKVIKVSKDGFSRMEIQKTIA